VREEVSDPHKNADKYHTSVGYILVFAISDSKTKEKRL
jgi:hypothetical protein